jgi:hypothetical protein
VDGKLLALKEYAAQDATTMVRECAHVQRAGVMCCPGLRHQDVENLSRRRRTG